MGFGLAPKLTIVALIVFFPVVVNVLDGLASVDKDLIALVRAMGGTRWRIFRSVTLPATLTPLFSALKMTATFAVTGAVIGEWTASTTGGLGCPCWKPSPGSTWRRCSPRSSCLWSWGCWLSVSWRWPRCS